MMNDTDGIYGRTQAFNFLKDLLGIPKKVLINEEFFKLFFMKESEGYYLIKKPEVFIKELFTKEGIAELNKAYYQNKLKNPEKAKEISQKVTKIVRESLAA